MTKLIPILLALCLTGTAHAHPENESQRYLELMRTSAKYYTCLNNKNNLNLIQGQLLLSMQLVILACEKDYKSKYCDLSNQSLIEIQEIHEYNQERVEACSKKEEKP